MIARGAQVEWVPIELKAAVGENGRGANANVGKTPIMVAMTGGRGAGLAGGPGFTRLGLPPFREQSNRDPVEALKVLLAAGANVNAKAPDGATALHQAVQARKPELIRTLVSAGREVRREEPRRLDAARAGREARRRRARRRHAGPEPDSREARDAPGSDRADARADGPACRPTRKRWPARRRSSQKKDEKTPEAGAPAAAAN